MSRPIRVLLVEDDDDDRLITCDTLEEVVGTRYEVTWVATAEAGIERLVAGEVYDIALVDFRLGGLTGVDLLDAVRRHDVDTPCILLTGERDLETDRAALEAGAADFIVKGEFDARQLERSIRYAIGRAADLRTVRRSEMELRSVVEAANDGIVLFDDDGVVLRHNRRLAELFEGPDWADGQRSFDGVSFTELLTEQSSATLIQLVEDELARRAEVRLGPVEVVARRLDGEEFPIEVSLASAHDDQGSRNWAGVVRDVSERTRLAAEVLHQAFHDPLTDLANRALLQDRIEQALAGLERNGGHVGVVLCDLDDFKGVNDTFGHEVGDRLLTAVAGRLTGALRPVDTVARLGGDEFAVCLPAIPDPTLLIGVVERLMRALREPFDVDGRVIETSASIGLVVCDGGDDPEAVLHHADLAMYAAKTRGPDRYEVFEGAMHGALVERIELQADLRGARQREELSVHYQPVFDLRTGDLTGFEALMRWEHPVRGPVSPAVFVSVAEETGLIRELGRWVLDRAVADAAGWQRTYPGRDDLSIAVNLSSRQLADPDLVAVVATALEQHRLAPGTLTLEITESVMVGDVDHVVNVLEKLRALGVQLALDDFGAGSSSLHSLHRLPLDVVKVDRCVVDRMDDDGAAALTGAIVALGENLGLDTVAEGVESADQRDVLRREGYTYGQGYLFASPLTAEEAGALLARLSDGAP